jgi:hypothetical protein
MKMCPAQLINAPLSDAMPPGYSMLRPEPPTSDFRGWCQKNCNHPATMIMMLDSNGSPPYGFIGGNGGGWQDVLAVVDRHFGGVNVLWADQHVTWETYDNIQQGIATKDWNNLCSPPCPPGSFPAGGCL